MKKPHITAVMTAAGGTGKTALARALAAGLHDRGRRVLLVDMDSQGNATWLARANKTPTVVDAMTTGDAAATIQHTAHMDIIAGGEDLVGIDVDLSARQDGLHALEKALSSVASQYDNIVIDCPPGAGMAVYCSMVAADDILVPAPPAIKSVSGMTAMMDTISSIRAVNKALVVNGIVVTRKAQARSNLTKMTISSLATVADQFGVEVYGSQIREAVAQGEADLLRDTIYNTAPTSALAADYNSFVDEYIAKEK